LIEAYDLEVFTPPCGPGSECLTAVARLTTDIREVFPYLNATLLEAAYDPAAPAVIWTRSDCQVAFHPCQIAISEVVDREAALREVESLVELVNRTWERQGEIEPDYRVRRRPAPLALFQLLPGTNCKQCGRPTCFTFALQLAAAQARPEGCPPLLQPQHADHLAQLRAMVEPR